MRLLYCAHCRTLEEVPDYHGEEEPDPLIEELVRQHNVRDPMAHGGASLTRSPMRVAVVEDKDWEHHREAIIKRLNESMKEVGFAPWVNEAMNTYAEDALKCYSVHHRPKEGCIDYWSDTKRIGRPTLEGRKAVKEGYRIGEQDPHLCQWCPVHSFVQTQKNWKAGLYKK